MEEVMSRSIVDAAPGRAHVRRLRGPRVAVDPEAPVAVWDEVEVAGPGRTVASRVVILAGAECRYTCAMCDLWRHTLPAPTAPGRLPRQVRLAVERPWDDGAADGAARGFGRWIKLYNGSNFFDPSAVPPDDLPAIARLVAGSGRVIVENHPRLTRDAVPRFRDRLACRLEVAMGLETVHADVLPRLGKQMTLDDFASACDRLRAWDVDIRAFVLLGLPWLEPDAFVAEAVRGVAFAAAHGVRHVSLVPLRPGNGFIDALVADGRCRLPTAAHVEQAAARLVDRVARPAATGAANGETGGMVVTVDLWDWPRLAGTCAACREPRRLRLEWMNLAQATVPPAVLGCGCSVGSPGHSPGSAADA